MFSIKKLLKVLSLEVITTLSKQELSYLVPPKPQNRFIGKPALKIAYIVYEMNFQGSPLEKQEGTVVVGMVLKPGRK